MINSQDISVKTVNHVRVMIEETEISAKSHQHYRKKLFVILLHFPPSRFFEHCYPTLFLKGWNHYYLDTISHSYVTGVVDILDWLQQSCAPDVPDLKYLSANSNAIYKAALQLVHQIIPVIQAHMQFGCKNDNSFNARKDEVKRREDLVYLLKRQKLDEVLSSKFSYYWDTKVMLTNLERAATLSVQEDSTLSITDLIQTDFKKLFSAFCVHMLYRANENFNLDIAFKGDNLALFVDIFKLIPIPPLNQLSILTKHLNPLKPVTCQPNFPFFSFVYNLIEELVGKSFKKTNLDTHNLSALEESDTSNLSKSNLNPAMRLKVLISTVINKLEAEVS